MIDSVKISPETIEATLDELGLGHLAPHIKPLLRPSIAMHLGEGVWGEYDVIEEKMHDTSPLGASKVGGLPDLPPGFDWPQKIGDEETISLAFLAQIRLEEAAPFDREKALPPHGMLWVFHNLSLDDYGEEVLWSEDVAFLDRRELPANRFEFAEVAPRLLTFSFGWSLPATQGREMQGIFEEFGAPRPPESHRERDAYGEFHHKMHAPHHLLGHADVLHFDGRPNVRQKEGLSWNDRETSEDVARWEREAPCWRLLLQFSPEDDFDWGVAVIYAYIHERALAERDFSGVAFDTQH